MTHYCFWFQFLAVLHSFVLSWVAEYRFRVCPNRPQCTPFAPTFLWRTQYYISPKLQSLVLFLLFEQGVDAVFADVVVAADVVYVAVLNVWLLLRFLLL